MNQLKMVRNNTPVGYITFPEGYYMRPYREGDGPGWCECCVDGKLGVDEISEAVFKKIMLDDKTVNPQNIYFLISPSGEIAGTTTYQYNEEECAGTIHMVAITKKYLGKGLSLPMLLFVVQKIIDDGKELIYLSTDDWRLPAIKTYFKADFEPVYYLPDMKERWLNVHKLL